MPRAPRREALKLDKAQLLEALRESVRLDLETMLAAQRHTQEGATHEESRPENDKDTRALESTYLARGQVARGVELGDALTQLNALQLREFGGDTPVALTALVTLADDNQKESYYFLAPSGGGTRLSLGGTNVSVVTPGSPIGRALLGKFVGESLEVRTPQGMREVSIVTVQ